MGLPLLGVPGTGQTIILRGINVFRVTGDKIVERWGQLDELGVLRQLGLAPA
jgi:predicted ester cyclase